ncbi:MAG: MarR family transcriptional regulator [Pseudomonadota bacterium]|nr:MarR family transcriptional regulator [Pseudomonadota bacterium]
MENGEKVEIELAGLSDYFGYQLRQAQTASFRDLASPFRKLGISPGEFSLLTIVQANPEIRQTDLIRIYRLDKSTMSVAVNRLVERGLISRKKLPKDRRFHGLTLTRAGRQLLTTATGVVEEQEKRMASALSSDEWEIAISALRRIAVHLKIENN